MADRVELIIQLTGDKEALSSMQNLQRAINSMRNSKIDIRIDQAALRKQINDTRSEIRRLQEELGKTKPKSDAYKQVNSQLQDQKKHLQDLQAEYAKLVQRAQENSAAIAAGTQQQREFTREAQESVVAVNALGNALQSAASASSALGRFAEGIGQAFTGMSSIFQFNVLDNVERMLTYMATRGITGSLGNAVNRLDILNTFSDYMQLAGVQADVAERSLKRVNDAILGLPIGLDEAAQRLRRYQMFLGDVERATNLTIGIQNALFAGGANEAARTTAYYQIDRLLTVGRLNTARQWNALLVGLGVSTRFIAEEMGYSFKNISDFAAGLSNGSISTNEFLRALERLGTGATSAGQKLQHALDIYKGTVDSWMRNISFAFQRGTANLMGALDESLEQISGRGITGYMERFRNAINDFYRGGVTLLQENPQLVASNMGAVERLLESLSRFSGSEIAVNALQNIARFIDMLTQALDRLPAGKTEEFVAFAITLAGPLGKLFAAVSSGLPAMLGVFERFRNFNFEELLDKIMTQVERLAGVISGLLNLIPDGLMGDIIAFGLVWGKPVAAALTAIAGAIRALGGAMAAAGTQATASGLLKEGGILAWLLRFAQLNPSVVAGVGIAVSSLVGITSVMGKVNSSINEIEQGNVEATERIRKQFGIVDISPIVASVNATIKSISDARTAWEDEQARIELGAEKSADIAKRILEIDDQIRSANDAERDKLISQRAVAIQQLEAIQGDLGLTFNLETGALDHNSRAWVENAESIQAWATQARESAKRDYVSSLAAGQFNAEVEIDRVRRQIEENRIKRQELEDELRRATEEAQASGPRYNPGGPFNGLRVSQNPQWETVEGIERNIKNLEASNFILRMQEANLAMRLGITVEELRSLMDAYDDVGDAAGESVEAQIAAAEELEEVQKKWTQLEETIQQTIQKQLSGYEEMEKFTAKPLGEMTKGLDSQAEAARQYTDSIDTVMDYIARTGRTDLLEIIQGWGESGLDATPLFMGLAESVTKGGEEAIDEFVKSTNEHLKEKMKSEAFAGVLAAAADGFDEGEIEYLKQQYGAFGEEMLNAIFEGYDKALQNRRESYELKTALLERTGTFDDPTGRGEGPADGFVENFKDNERSMRRAAEEFYEPVIEGAGEAKDSLTSRNGLSDSVDRVARVMEEKRRSADNFASSISDIGTQANIVIHALTSLKAAIDALQDKEVTLTVNTVENAVSGVVAGGITGSGGGGGGGRPGGGGTPLPYATGGFLPRGTDTVAALLSPGEFVMRKGAVDAVGGAFLSRLNSLDIRGAIDSMMSRYYRPSSVATATSYTTNSYDNRNITVNQNVRTNSPRYANRRIMSRFAHAL